MFSLRSVRRIAAVSGAVALSIALAACGGAAPSAAPAAPTATASAPSGSPSSAVDGEHNDADIAFAQMMIAHHRQAVEMAELAVDRAQRPEIKDLAEQIRASQEPEIIRLTAFLQAWGAETPPAAAGDGGMGGMTGMDHAGGDGMMTPAQMQELRDATGAAFDSRFLQMMIEHHRGAVAAAKDEVASGANGEAVALASTIAANQTAEISRMEQLQQSS